MLGVWRALLRRGMSSAGRPGIRGLAEAAHSTESNVEEDQYSETEVKTFASAVTFFCPVFFRHL